MKKSCKYVCPECGAVMIPKREKDDMLFYLTCTECGNEWTSYIKGRS